MSRTKYAHPTLSPCANFLRTRLLLRADEPRLPFQEETSRLRPAAAGTAAGTSRFSDDWRWTMPSNASGQSRGFEIIVAFVVVVFLAFLFFGDQFGAVSDGSHLNAKAKVPPPAHPPAI